MLAFKPCSGGRLEIDRWGGGEQRGEERRRRSVLILAKRSGWIQRFNYAGRHALG